MESKKEATAPSSMMIGDQKYELYESSTTDSGFLSGGNLVLSGEIAPEDEVVEAPRGRDQEQGDGKEDYVRLDSGVDVGLNDSFSELDLKKSGESDSVETDTEKAVVQPSWEVYYAQDEEGDT